MSRTLAAAVATAVADDNIRAAVLTYFNFDSGVIRFWTGIGPLVWSGDTFTGAGSLGGIGAIEETTEIKATGLTFTLSGIPSSLITIALDEDYQGRACTCWIAFFDSNWALITDPVQVFSGRMDTMALSDDGENATIVVAAENRLVDLDRPNNVLYMTNNDQQALYPGDRGLEYVPAMQEAVIVWGRSTLPPGGGQGGAGAAPASGGIVGVPPEFGGSEDPYGGRNQGGTGPLDGFGV